MSIDTGQDTATSADVAVPPRHVRIAIVGAGFSGLGLAIRLKQRGNDDFVVLERAEDVGGTWRDNTYPGCACDVPSHLYSFSFAPNPNWTHHFSPQPEIWAYLRECVERFGIRPHIRFSEEVRDATWDDAAQCWRITTSRGMLTAGMLAMGNGPLSEPSLPSLPGIVRFASTMFHSAQWNHDYDLTGKRVAVIGTGASAIQFVPQIQPQVAHLTLFQRTPPWILPRQDRAISEHRRTLFRRLPFAQRLVRSAIYWQREINVLGLVYRSDILKSAERLSLRHLAAQVPDPALRAKLTPGYTMGCKRILLSDDFYPALTRDNVEVVTTGIEEIREASVVSADGREHPVDTLIFATGFHVTDMPAAQYIRGRNGKTLADAWRSGPEAYLGTMVAGFPNLFLLIGPNTGLGHTSMVFMIESQVAYILDCLRQMERRGVQAVEVRLDAQKSFNEEIQRRMQGTVWTSGCASWYLHAGGRNTTIWPGFTGEFWRRTRRFDPASYTLTRQVVAAREMVTE